MSSQAMDPTWMDEMVSMMSGGVTGETVMKRVKQESDSTLIYSPPDKLSSIIYYEDNTQTKEQIKYETAPSSPDFCSSTTQPIGPTQTEEVPRDEEQPRRLCLVCGDIASGFHYGVASCEACKAFFKRTIQGNIEYTCPASNECEINKRRRKACQACRFKKCLRTGMLREGVRLDRVRGGRQKYRRPTDSLPLTSASRPALQDIKLVEVVCSFEPELLSSPSGAASSLHALADLYDRELVGVIGWAKQIPGFTELQLNDQMRLLQSTWAELLSLMLAYRSMHQQTGPGGLRLKFAHDLTLDEQEAKDIGAHELYQQVVQIVARLERVTALKEECYLLKALALANSEARLDDGAALRKFRDSILAALNDAVAIQRPYNASTALQQLLLVLPSLRAADACVRRFWLSVQRAGTVPMNKLFVEMLEAYFR